MLNKSVIIFLACVLFIDFTPVRGQSHIINECSTPGDNPVVIYDQDVTKGGHVLHYQTETVRIPATGVANSVISCLTVTNLDSAENGGYPTIVEGGLGYNYVILQLKSQFGQGFNFRVTAYYAG